ncbi:MAG TPA: hypothetical protein ENJ30_02935, partial [Desulfobulbaceae bacterium]|nr:hypothetical protein [Desulfobulbaceae bacterium]
MFNQSAGLRPVHIVRENGQKGITPGQNSANVVYQRFQQPVTIWSEPFRPVSCAVSLSHLAEGFNQVLDGLQHPGISEFETGWAAIAVIAVAKQFCLEFKPY